jgi:hypothetical protein
MTQNKSFVPGCTARALTDPDTVGLTRCLFSSMILLSSTYLSIRVCEAEPHPFTLFSHSHHSQSFLITCLVLNPSWLAGPWVSTCPGINAGHNLYPEMCSSVANITMTHERVGTSCIKYVIDPTLSQNISLQNSACKSSAGCPGFRSGQEIS